MHEHSSKPCRTCGLDKSPDEYRRDKYRKDGRTSSCRSCMGRGPRKPGTYYFNNSGVCRLCGRGKPEVEFGIDRGTKLGISTICKPCKRAEGLKYSAKNRESIRATNTARVRRIRLDVLLHYGGMPPMCACCGEAHLEFLAIDHIGGGGRKHLQETCKTAGHKFHKWLRDNDYPEGFRVLCHGCNHCTSGGRPCPHSDPTWERDLRSESKSAIRRYYFLRERRLAILKHYGGDQSSCACCGESHIRFLAIDHINGGGYRQSVLENRLPLIYILWRDGLPPGYQILCQNCNMAKGFYGRCPHEASTDHVDITV